MNVTKIFVLLILTGAFWGCKGNYDHSAVKIDKEKIYGNWVTTISNGDFNGQEFIRFKKNGDLEVSDSLLFTGEDSGFKFTMPVSIFLSGLWTLSNDSIFIKYDSSTLTIDTPEDRFYVEGTKKESEEGVLDSIKDEMSFKLSELIKKTLTAQYNDLSSRDLFYGKIGGISSDSILILNNNAIFSLYKEETGKQDLK